MDCIVDELPEHVRNSTVFIWFYRGTIGEFFHCTHDFEHILQLGHNCLWDIFSLLHQYHFDRWCQEWRCPVCRIWHRSQSGYNAQFRSKQLDCGFKYTMYDRGRRTSDCAYNALLLSHSAGRCIPHHTTIYCRYRRPVLPASEHLTFLMSERKALRLYSTKLMMMSTGGHLPRPRAWLGVLSVYNTIFNMKRSYHCRLTSASSWIYIL